MKKWICQVCGYVFEGENPPEKCPQCGVGPEKFSEQKGEMSWAAEHVVGVAAGVDAEILEGLRANFSGECTEVGMYLAMARVAHREGYPEIGLYWEKAAYEEAATARRSKACWSGTSAKIVVLLRGGPFGPPLFNAFRTRILKDCTKKYGFSPSSCPVPSDKRGWTSLLRRPFTLSIRFSLSQGAGNR